MTYRVTITWDVEGNVWAAGSRDLPWLAAEDPDREALLRQVRALFHQRQGEEGELVFHYEGPVCR